jgi:hypothetical protein
VYEKVRAVIRTIRRYPSRRSFGVVLTAVTALLLASCGSDPAQARSAAVVGDHVIQLDEVQAEVRWLLDHAPQAQQAREQRRIDQISSEIVRSRVVHELLAVAEERENLRVDETKVDELIEASGGVEEAARNIAVEPSRVRDVARDQLLLEQLGKHYQHRLSVHFVGAMITESDAEATDSEVARALGRRIAADPANVETILRDSGHQVIDRTITLADALNQDPELAISAVFGAEEGAVVVIRPSQQQVGWLVALIKDRTVRSDVEEPEEDQPVDPRLLYWAGLRQLQPIADELGVQINPRYGVWDDTGLAPAPSEEEVTGYQWESRTVQP